MLRGFGAHSFYILTFSAILSVRMHKINPIVCDELHRVMVKIDFPACYTQTVNCLFKMSLIIFFSSYEWKNFNALQHIILCACIKMNVFEFHMECWKEKTHQKCHSKWNDGKNPICICECVCAMCILCICCSGCESFFPVKYFLNYGRQIDANCECAFECTKSRSPCEKGWTKA